jgi:CRP-like cAMP-binding protein
MLDHDLETAVLRRVLALRQFALLDGVDLAELATLAQNVVETELAPGAVVAVAGERLPAVHLVLDGCIASAEPAVGRWRARDVFGVLELFAGRRASTGARATMRTRTLRLDAEDVSEILDDNFGVLMSVIRAVAGLVVAREPIARPHVLALPTNPLGLVDRLLLLRRQLPFAQARIRALATLAHVSRELSWPTGAPIACAGELATSAYLIIEGNARAVGGAGEPLPLAPGDAIGLLETLAGRAHAATFEVTSPVRALASSSAALFDVLEDHTDLGLDILAMLARELLDQPTRSAPR